MTVIKQNAEFKITFNGVETWMMIDNTNYCCGVFPTERRALNAYKRACKAANISE